MKKLGFTILILTMLANHFYGQNNPKTLNAYKYAYIQDLTYTNGQSDIFNLSSKSKWFFRDLGFTVLDDSENLSSYISKLDPCEIFYVTINNKKSSEVTMEIRNCKGGLIYKDKSKAVNWFDDLQDNYDRSLQNIFKKFENYTYKYTPNETIKVEYPEVEKTNENDLTLRNYYSTNNIHEIEGIYKSYQSEELGYYMIGVKRFDNIYKAIIIESDYSHWMEGEVKAIFEPSSMKGLYSAKWYMENKSPIETFANLENASLLAIEFNNIPGKKHTDKFIKMFPPSSESYSPGDKGIKASGSGFVISVDGIIATNAHVIKDAESIEVSFVSEFGQIIYAARVLLKDESNDVALLKIEDSNFKEFSQLPYSIIHNTKIGEDVFTIGYPLNSLMGENYKVTNGIVCSNTGFKDDIRHIQITTPLQPGNSGGPLFNKNGDVVGLTTSKLNGSSSGITIENVNYAIKANYLLNIYNMLPNHKPINANSTLSNKDLKDQIKILKNYVCLIKIY